MSELLNLIIAGAISGALYSLIAAGLVVSYTATGIFNLGYGAVAFTCAFLYYELHSGLGWPIAAALVVTIGVFAPLLGLGLDRLVFRNLTRASEAAKVMATVGILIALPAFAKWLVDVLVSTGGAHIPTGDQVYLAPGIGPSPRATFRLGAGITVTSDQVIVFGIAVVAALCLWLLMSRTSLGLKMRAVVDRPDLAQMRAIDPHRTSSAAWIIGTVLAGLAGVAGAPIFNSLDPNTYTVIIFAAIAAAVIGGLRSVPLAFVGGMALGVIENLVSGYATFAQSIDGFSSAVPFVVLLAGLFLLGRDRSRKASTLVDHLATADANPVVRPLVRRAVPLGSGLLLVLFFVEALASKYYVSLTTEGLALGLIFLSYTLITGLGGLVSLAQAAFVSGSGLLGGLLMDRIGLPWIVALLCGTAFAVLLGCIVAIPSLQLGGLSFALASLALGLLGDQVLFAWGTLGNGSNGWTIAPPFGLAHQKVMAVVLVMLIAGVAISIRQFQNSPTGRAAIAVRSSEAGAASSAVSVPAVKLWIFGISAGIAGFGGFLLASVQASANGSTFTTQAGLVWLASVVLWGIRRSGSAVIAGLAVVVFPGFLLVGIHWWYWVPSWLSWNGTKNTWIPQILFGLGAVQMARSPDGILALATRRDRRRARIAVVTGSGESADGAEVSTSRPVPSLGVGSSAKDPANHKGAAVPASAVLQLRGVCAGYGDVAVLRDVDLNLYSGTITALVGPNGAGKSTLVGALAGSVAITGGTTIFNGRDLANLPVHLRARGGILIAPESRGIFPGLSVEENLAIRLPQVVGRNQVYAHFPILAERRKLPAGSLSGGEQQMLTLGSLLVEPPTVLVADEPTLGLAPLVVEQVLGVIERLRDEGVAILLIEEKARVILEIADRVAFLDLGRISWQGSRQEVDEDRLRSTFLGIGVQSAAGGEHPWTDPVV